MIVALELDRSIDLQMFSGYLAQTGVRHRISEEGDKQVVRVNTEQDAEVVRALYERVARGEIHFERHEPPASARPRQYPMILLQMRRAPLTVLLVLINIACYPVTSGIEQGHVTEMLRLMTLVDFHVKGNAVYFSHLSDTMASGQYWRLLTPMFLHFGVMHIVFNLLWVWEVGRRIEMVNGALTLLSVVILTSLGSNLAQYQLTGPAMFGGMSGVVFGLLGYSFVWSRLVPARSMALPTGIYLFLVIYLALGFAGVIDFIIPGQLANGAHLGGLVSGAALGLLFALPAKK